MMLRPMHMAKGHIHHAADDLGGIGRRFRQTQAENTVHPLRVAVAAHIMSFHAAGLTQLLLMTNSTLHHLILREIFQRGFADQTFFFHTFTRYLFGCDLFP